jgi:hypothetical protein
MQYYMRGIPGMPPKQQETLRVMYKNWRRVLGREQSTVAPK